MATPSGMYGRNLQLSAPLRAVSSSLAKRLERDRRYRAVNSIQDTHGHCAGFFVGQGRPRHFRAQSLEVILQMPAG
jgi:hypothetical protein